MIIKTFTAESSAAALKQVRSELGREAVVLKTREIPGPNGTGRIEITACLDGASVPPQQAAPAPARVPSVRPAVFKSANPPEPINRLATPPTQVPAIRPAASVMPEVSSDLFERLARIEKMITILTQRSGTNNSSDRFAEIRAKMAEADLPTSIVDLLTSNDDANTDPATLVERSLSDLTGRSVSPALSFRPGDRIVFFGPAGAGKTSVLGKLAARLTFQEKRKVTLITLDRVKIGAFEEIQSYADILGARTAGDDSAAHETDQTSVTLIDTPAWSNSSEQQERLSTAIAAFKPNYRFLVASALTRSSDISEQLDRLIALAPTHGIMTMFDLTRRWGSVLAAFSPELKLAFTTNGPAGIGSLNAPDPVLIVRQILNSEVSRG